MQSKTTRGLRRLLVSTGVISLVLSVAAPAALASQPPGVGKPQDRVVQLLGPLSDDGKKMWVCHSTASSTNPVVGIWVSVNAQGHLEHDDEEVDLEECPMGLPPTAEIEPVIVVPVEDGLPAGSGDGAGGGQFGSDGGGDGAGGGQSGDNGNAPGAPASSTDDAPAAGDQTDSKTPTVDDPTPGETISSAVTVERPTPVVPAVPAAPQAPATPATPAAPAAQPAVTNAPTTLAAPATPAAAPATSSRTEVLGSVTTRTPGGTTVTALAATGTSTTVVLAALGAVLLLAGLGLQVTARRVQSSHVGA